MTNVRTDDRGRIHVPVAHFSGEVFDSRRQQKSDVDKVWDRILEREMWWMTFTEAGPESGLNDLHREKAREHGFNITIGRSTGVVVDRSRIVKGSWRAGWHFAVDNDETVGPGHDLGVTRAGWTSKDLGCRVTNLASHYATKGTPVGTPDRRVNLDENTRLAALIGELGRKYGKGKDLVFYGGDQNIRDDRADTFLGRAKFLTLGDEKGKHPDTGHGAIDVIASWKPDARVEAAGWRALNDREFHLHSDHHYTEGGFWVEPIPA